MCGLNAQIFGYVAMTTYQVSVWSTRSVFGEVRHLDGLMPYRVLDLNILTIRTLPWCCYQISNKMDAVVEDDCEIVTDYLLAAADYSAFHLWCLLKILQQ